MKNKKGISLISITILLAAMILLGWLIISMLKNALNNSVDNIQNMDHGHSYLEDRLGK